MSYRKSNLESSTYNTETSVFSASLTPGVSYFIIDKLAIGLNATFSYDGSKNNKSYTLGIGPELRYYFSNGLFLNAEVDYNYLHYISNNSKANYFSFKPGVGYSIFLNQKVSLEPGIFYEIADQKFKRDSFGDATIKTNTIMFDLTLNFFL